MYKNSFKCFKCATVIKIIPGDPAVKLYVKPNYFYFFNRMRKG